MYKANCLRKIFKFHYVKSRLEIFLSIFLPFNNEAFTQLGFVIKFKFIINLYLVYMKFLYLYYTTLKDLIVMKINKYHLTNFKFWTQLVKLDYI